MAGKFVIKKSGDQYHFVLKAGNGEIIATSERYKSKASAKNGIESVKEMPRRLRSTTRPGSSPPRPASQSRGR